MKPLDRILAAVRARPRHIILPEGGDPRVAEAAARMTAEGLARITLMDGPAIAGVTALAPAEAPDLPELAEHWHRMRAARGMTADRALAELLRLGAFERKVLIVAMPTGTGWLDPGSFDVVEYMHQGDIATVAVQYSYLQSPLALLLETNSGLEQATALIRTIHAYWRSLPRETPSSSASRGSGDSRVSSASVSIWARSRAMSSSVSAFILFPPSCDAD